MARIQIRDLTFTYPGSFDAVFEHLDLQLDTGWKLGLVGRNGRGKTTLLRLLQGEYEYRGAIQAPVVFDYFPAPVPDPDRPARAVLAGACPGAADWQRERELSLLEVDPGALDRPFATLSAGERTKVLLAALFLREGRFPLIDEPTNHLDARGRATVAAYLRRKPGFFLVSHDRAFLDGCVDHILALNRADVRVRAGSCSAWLEDFAREQAGEEARDERLRKDVRRLQAAARQAADWSDRAEAGKYGAGPVDRGYVGHKAAKMMKRAKVIQARREQAAEDRSALLKNRETAEPLKLFPQRYVSGTLAEFREVAVCYGERPVCAPVSFTLRRGDRLALEGPNGSGKSSLLGLLLGRPIPHTGSLRVGSGLVISHVPQEPGPLAGSLADFARAGGLDESLFKAILRKMDFSRAQFEKDMRDLSAGQKKKVLLARSLCQRAHLYIWDEPLNYIDLYSRLQIEELIRQFAPTLLFVEHDAAFRQAAATGTVALRPPEPGETPPVPAPQSPPEGPVENLLF